MTSTHPVLQSSTIAALLRRTSTCLKCTWQSSNVCRVVEGIGYSPLADTLTRAITHSFLYRWLTAEADPEVIVIDLIDTYTVGPIIAMGNRAAIVLAPIWRTSRCKRVVDGIVRILEFIAQSETGQMVTAFFEPPEPPEDRE